MTNASCQPNCAIRKPSTGTIRNWPNDPAAAVMPIAQLRRSGAMLRPITPYTTAKVVPACAMPINTPALAPNNIGVFACAMPNKPSAYSKAPTMMTRKAPNLSATMPAKMPDTPQEIFWIAMAKENASRLQSRACVTGCSHKPKPCRIPMDSVTIAAPHSNTCVRLSVREVWRMTAIVCAFDAV